MHQVDPKMGLFTAISRLRRILSNIILGMRAGRAVSVGRIRDAPPLIAGFLSTASGIGQSARLCFRAFSELDLAPRSFDLSPHFNNADIEHPAERPVSMNESAGPLILHANAPEVPTALSKIGRRRTMHRRIIGYWAWELPVFPKGWNACAKHLHEIWVPSQFVKQALAKVCTLPIKVVAHPVFEPLPVSQPRHPWGWPKDLFIVLSIFDMRSSFQRKNPLSVVRAFKAAFEDALDTRLVLKVSNGTAFPQRMAELTQEIGDARNIQLLTDILDESKMTALIAATDVLISLHRAEGFGLTLTEAMAMGKPVIATAWSGNMDFMSTDCAALVGYELTAVDDPDGIYDCVGAQWAEPDIDEASAWLKKLHLSPELRHELGARGRTSVLNTLGLKAYAKSVHEALQH